MPLDVEVVREHVHWTAAAAASLVERVGGKVCGIACLIELDALNGRDRVDGHELFTLIHY